MSDKIDWAELAREFECANRGSTILARRALEKIVGESRLTDAVDHYIAGLPGAELARSVLWHLHPPSAMKKCYDIYLNGDSIESKRSAVELLRVVADERCLPWVDEFLAHPDETIQEWGIGLLDQLLWSNFVQEDDCSELLNTAEKHDNKQVRELAAFIRKYLKERSR